MLNQIAIEMLQHVGRENAITADRMAEKLHFGKISNCAMRTLIHEVVAVKEMPILSCRDGFFIATCKEEVDNYNDSMNRRIAETINSQIAMNNAFRKWHR